MNYRFLFIFFHLLILLNIIYHNSVVCEEKLLQVNTFSDLLKGGLNGGKKIKNNDKTVPEVVEESEKLEEEEKIEEKNPLIISDNNFPPKYNVFCVPNSVSLKDRFCYGNLDAYIIGCAHNNYPLHLASFCFGFKHLCSKVNFPNDGFCDKEYEHYSKFCKIDDRDSCSLDTKVYCDYANGNGTRDDEVSRLAYGCFCDPYKCLIRRGGLHTANWCQRYELFCDSKKREEESQELSQLITKAIVVHQHCTIFLHFAKVLCNPFGPDYDEKRCTKFLFDCELITDFTKSEGLKSTEVKLKNV
uniref:DB domain-containing protein n=2 Tax=Strongyloides papillosus TaxID=174720 RepID=A0A0N5B584_STREA